MWSLEVALLVTDPAGQVVLRHEGPLPVEQLAAAADGRDGVLVWISSTTGTGLLAEVDAGPMRDGGVRMRRRESRMSEELGEIVAIRPRWRNRTWDVRMVLGVVGALEDRPACDLPLVETRFDDGTGWRAPEGAAPDRDGLVVVEGEEPPDAIGRVGSGWARWDGPGPAPVMAVRSVGDPRATLAVPCLEVTAATSVPAAAALVFPEEVSGPGTSPSTTP